MHPLDGIKITDITTMINGPYTTMLLSDMGADVIKIEPPDGDPWRGVGGGFLGCNRGKRAITVDLKKQEARDIVYKLIAQSDLFVENARWGVWHKLGLDYASLIKIKPDIIYLSVLGHGSQGPYSNLPGYDPLLQARSGQMVGQGGIGKPPVFHKIALNDSACPMLGAYGAALGLLVRARTGKGQRVETSLTNASIAMQSADFIDYPGFKRKYQGDTDIKGVSATRRYYQAGDDQWIFVFCPDERHWQSLCKVIELENLLSDPRFESPDNREENDGTLVEILGEVFQTKTSTEWLALLPQADVPTALGQSVEKLLKDRQCQENNIIDEREYSGFGSVRLVGVGPKFSDMSGIIRRPAPLLGEHTEEVLEELGYTGEQIAGFKKSKIAFTPSELGA